MKFYFLSMLTHKLHNQAIRLITLRAYWNICLRPVLMENVSE